MAAKGGYKSGYDMPDSLPCDEIGQFKVSVENKLMTDIFISVRRLLLHICPVLCKCAGKIGPDESNRRQNRIQTKHINTYPVVFRADQCSRPVQAAV